MLIDRNSFCVLEKITIFVKLGCVCQYYSRVAVMSSGLTEFYIAEFWIEQ